MKRCGVRSSFGLAVILMVQFLVFAACTGNVRAGQECLTTSWPHELSDLKPDPALHFGRLENGIRYVLMQHHEPRDRVAVYLDIQAGSLHESDQERGMAHFLEHMLFNGTTNFPPGTLVDYFQSIGMSFGGDVNAHTSFDETVYNLILPDASRKQMEGGLLLMADYARGALLLEDEIDRERGVILAEMRSRDSAQYRSYVQEMAFTMAGTQVAERMPIGTVQAIESFDQAGMRSYYDSWYRPENMILVMVGDFELDLAQELIKQQFASLKAGLPSPECPELGVIPDRGLEFFVHQEPELGRTEITVESLWNEVEAHDSLALQQRELKEYLAAFMLQHRLTLLQEQAASPISSSRVYAGKFQRTIGYSTATIQTGPDQWRQGLALLEQTLRQALEFGFSEQELTRVKKELSSQLEESVLTASSRKSRVIADSLIQAMNRNRVFQSPLQEREIYGPILAGLSLAEVESAFREMWSHNNRFVQVSGNAEIKGTLPLEAVRTVYAESATRKLIPWVSSEIPVFPYLSPVHDAQTASRKHLPGIKAEQAVLGNGLRVNVKQTAFEDNGFELRLDLGQGLRNEPVPGLGLLAEAVVNDSGTGTLQESALDRVLSGSSVEFKFEVSPASLAWNGKAVKGDMELLFQVLQALLLDPGVRDEAYGRAMDRFSQMYQQMENDVQGGMALTGEAYLAGGYPHFGFPDWQDFQLLEINQVRAWYLAAIRSGEMELSLVGDVDPAQVFELAGRYLSGLALGTVVEPESIHLDFPQGRSLTVPVDSGLDKAMLTVAWPTTDFWDIGRTRRLHLLASILDDRLRKEVREKLGAAYSPRVSQEGSRIYPGYGVMLAALIVDPKQIDSLEGIVRQVGATLAQEGVTDEELERSRAPVLTGIKDMVRSNAYWLRSVLSLSSRYPMQLEWPLTIQEGFAAITAAELSELAHEYLAPERAAAVLVIPKR